MISSTLIPYGKHHIDEEDVQAVVDVLRSGVLTQGPAVGAFEQAVANYVGAKYAVAVSSATAALHLAAAVAGIGPGKTLITSPITFVASANAALYLGGNVAFADIDPETVNMSPIALKNALEKNPNTKAIIPVHFAGLPCNMTTIKSLADSVGSIVIEDAAHALGATYSNGRRVGCCEYSSMTIFSFHPVKAIAAGEGGMITTNDESIYRRLLRLRSHGINKLSDPFLNISESLTNGQQNPWYYEMQELGFHYRITDVQCALALSQFKKLDRFITRRRELVGKYDAAIGELKHCTPAQINGKNNSGHHLYVIRVNFKKLGLTRQEVMTRLKEQSIGTQVHYIPVPLQPYYQKLGFLGTEYPIAHFYYEEALTIPLFYDLTDRQQRHVISCLSDIFK